MIEEALTRQHFDSIVGLEKTRDCTPLKHRRSVAVKAIKSAQRIGQISNMITRACASGATNDTLIYLSNALQAAVDGIKWTTNMDWDKVAEIGKELPKLDWIDIRTDKSAWNDSAPVSIAPGVISTLWNTVQRWFHPIEIDILPPQAFASIVPKVRNPALADMVQYMTIHLYAGPITALMQLKNLSDEEKSSRLGDVCDIWRDWCEGQSVSIEGKQYDGLEPGMKEQIFALVWASDCDRGTSAAFIGFPDLIVKALETAVPKEIQINQLHNAVLLEDGRRIMQPAAEHMGYALSLNTV